jgi:hypothetical protein
MKMIKYLFVLPIFALVLYGCENVSEPFSIEEGAQPAFVLIETESQQVAAGSSLEVSFQLGQTQEENVTVEYSISGDAVEGEDYAFATGSAGTVVIEYDPESTNLDRGSVTLAFPIDAAFGTTKELTFTLESATTESGESLALGRGEEGAERTYTIGGLVEIQEGTYSYDATGDFGPFSGTFDVVVPEDPIVVEGTPYFITTSNITGDLFGAGDTTPYAFNVTAGGAVVGAPYSHVINGRILDVSGSYDDDTGEVTFDATFQCCGAAGFGFTMVASPQ